MQLVQLNYTGILPKTSRCANMSLLLKKENQNTQREK